MRGAGDETSIRVSVDGADRAVAVSGVLDGAAVAAVLAAASEASAGSGRLALDLLGVTAVEGDSLRSLARALRELGVDLHMSGPLGEAENSS